MFPVRDWCRWPFFTSPKSSPLSSQKPVVITNGFSVDKMQSSVIERECFWLCFRRNVLTYSFCMPRSSALLAISRPVNIILGAIVSLKYRSGWNITPPSLPPKTTYHPALCIVSICKSCGRVIVMCYLSIRINPTDFGISNAPNVTLFVYFQTHRRRRDPSSLANYIFPCIIIYIINVYLIGAGNP